MNAVRRAFAAERIKARRTSLWYLAFIFPLVSVLLPVSLVATRIRPDAAVNLVQISFMIWLRMLQPLFGVMIALASFQTEHNAGMWKHLNALPTRGPTQILAKHLVAALATVLANIALLLIAGATCGLLKLARPVVDLGLLAEAKPSVALGFTLSLASGLALVPVLVVIGARAQRALIGATLGLGGALCVAGNSIHESMTVMPFFPWSTGKVYSMFFDYNLMTGGAERVPLVFVAVPFWIAGSIAAHVMLQRQRPLF